MSRMTRSLSLALALLLASLGVAHAQPGAIFPNNLIISGSALGSPVTATAVGLDTNISIRFVPKGTGTAELLGIGGWTITQGTITAAAPALAVTSTWNNVAVTFTGVLVNVTDTTSAAASMLMDLQIGGVSQWQARKNGSTIQTGSITIGAAAVLAYLGRSRVASSGDGIMELTDSTLTTFTRLNLGPAAVTHTGLTASAAIAGQTQGIMIGRADGTPQVFANLGAAPNGLIIYCSDCTFASPCAGAGTGAYAKRLAGAWRCD